MNAVQKIQKMVASEQFYWGGKLTPNSGDFIIFTGFEPPTVRAKKPQECRAKALEAAAQFLRSKYLSTKGLNNEN